MDLLPQVAAPIRCAVIRAVIFDFYGTLTEAIRRGPAGDRAARVLGCDPAVFRLALDQTWSARARGELGSIRESLATLARRQGREPTAVQLDRAERLRDAAVRHSIRLRPDAVPTLRRLRARGLRTALVSDCTVELPGIVAGLPVAGLLDATVYSSDLGLTKPDPRLFQRAAGLLGLDPGHCLYVGDGGGRELTGAGAVGMTPVRLTEADLADHLVFNNEPPWSGARVPHLADVLDLL